MLENWVWNPDILKSLSGHYKDTGKKLPQDLLEKMIAAKNLNSGLTYSKQAFYASLDFTYHTTTVPDSTEVYRKLQDDMRLIPMTPGTHPQASFGHLMGGYDAAYYGYLWSEVFAHDMFARFESEGVLNPQLGAEYRRLILEPGGGMDEAGQLRLFLGREPNERAFLKSIGLQTEGPGDSPGAK